MSHIRFDSLDDNILGAFKQKILESAWHAIELRKGEIVKKLIELDGESPGSTVKITIAITFEKLMEVG